MLSFVIIYIYTHTHTHITTIKEFKNYVLIVENYLGGKKKAKKNQISQRHGTSYHEISPHNLIQCLPISFLYIYIQLRS